MAKGTVELIQTDTFIQKGLNKQLLPLIDKLIKTASTKAKSGIQRLLRSAILRQPEVESVLGGQLRLEFGLPDGSRRIDDILNTWISNVELKTNISSIKRGRIVAGFSIFAIKSDYSDVLNLSSAVLTTEKGQALPWLNWLLLEGDRVIVRDYNISFSPQFSNASRTGGAVMIEDDGGRWRVPPEFSGVQGNNFVTRALDEIESSISAEINKYIKD